MSEPTILRVVSEEIMQHILNEVIRTSHPDRIIQDALKQIEKYKKTGMLTVTQDLELRSSSEKELIKLTIPEGFKVNTIEKLSAYIAVVTAAITLLSTCKDSIVQVDQIFIEHCERCYIEQKTEQPKN